MQLGAALAPPEDAMSVITGTMLDRVRAKLLGVDGVRAAHAVAVGDEIEPIVLGGDDQAVRAALFRCVPLGILTRGDVVGTVTDSQGVAHAFKFSRMVVS